jgi:hypothetical protein
MKKDLLKEFFKRDLTEAEEEQLGQELASGPKKSMRFARLASLAYLKTGLPHPGDPHGGPGLGPHWGGLGGGMTLKILTTVAAGSAAVFYYSQTHHPPVAPPITQTLPARIAPAQPVIKTAPSVRLATAPSTFVAPQTSHPMGMVRPEAYDPSAKYEGLDLMVERKTTGLVTLRVMDPAGKEVRLLYAGILKPGKWHFLWEGKLENGDLAQPGTYMIEVQSGSEVLTKQIVIQNLSKVTQK